MEIDAVLGKNEKRNYFYAAFTIRKAREEAVGDRLIALVYVSMLLYVNLDAISFNYVRLALHFLFIQCIFLVTTGDLHLMPRV